MVSQGQGDQVSVRQFTGGKKWILSVDDEPAILYMREILLQTEGYEVLSAADGEHALTIFDAQPIDLVLLDYLMPGMDGSAVAEEIKRRRPNVPVIMVTATDLLHHVSMSADCIVPKGQSPAILLQTMKQFMSKGSDE
jgi:CheY-like chemotaxis protein